MRHRGGLAPRERSARSRLAQILHQEPVLRGSLVRMARVCGKAGCRCTRGEKHVSLYLAIRGPDGRKMIYVPPVWERTVRRWVASWREADGLIDAVSRECLRRFLAGKNAPPEGGGERTRSTKSGAGKERGKR